MDDFLTLEMDHRFRDFNFSAILDPTATPGGGPSQTELYKLAYLIRKGNRLETEFADAMAWTLRPESFQSFQALYGPRPIRYADWFYAKLEQFLSILMYEELYVHGLGPLGFGKPQTDRPWEEGIRILTAKTPLIQSPDLRKVFFPEHSKTFDWLGLVTTISQAGPRGFRVFQRFMRARLRKTRQKRGKQQRGAQLGPNRKSIGRRRDRRTERVKYRDAIILSGLAQELQRFEICKILDEKIVPITSGMKKHGCTRWQDAWTNLDAREKVQQVFSKTLGRQKSVKSQKFP